MSTRAITIRVDERVKEQAEKLLDEIGLNMTTYIGSSLKALLREKRVPFALAASEYLTDQMILEKLAESEAQAADPNTARLSHEEVFGKFRERLGYELQN